MERNGLGNGGVNDQLETDIVLMRIEQGKLDRALSELAKHERNQTAIGNFDRVSAICRIRARYYLKTKDFARATIEMERSKVLAKQNKTKKRY